MLTQYICPRALLLAAVDSSSLLVQWVFAAQQGALVPTHCYPSYHPPPPPPPPAPPTPVLSVLQQL
jgi:hypothetical protein